MYRNVWDTMHHITEPAYPRYRAIILFAHTGPIETW